MSSAVIIIWPLHHDFINTIKSELISHLFHIIEDKELEVSNNFIKNILREIHYGKIWWDQNIDNEYQKRIIGSDKQKLRYLIIKKKDIHLCCKSFKKTIREKYKIDKTYFHISDPDCFKHIGKNCSCECNILEFNKEANKHINMLTNKNTIHFLNNATYKKVYNFNKFFNDYRYGLLNSNLDPHKFCIDNGGVMAAYGIRDTHDLDFLTLYNDNIKVNNSNYRM